GRSGGEAPAPPRAACWAAHAHHGRPAGRCAHRHGEAVGTVVRWWGWWLVAGVARYGCAGCAGCAGWLVAGVGCQASPPKRPVTEPSSKTALIAAASSGAIDSSVILSMRASLGSGSVLVRTTSLIS